MFNKKAIKKIEEEQDRIWKSLTSNYNRRQEIVDMIQSLYDHLGLIYVPYADVPTPSHVIKGKRKKGNGYIEP